MNDAVVYVGKHEKPFRGVDQSCNALNNGNNVKVLNALHLNTETVFSGTYLSIQNDIIKAIGDVI